MITTLYHYHEVLSFVFGKAKLVAEYFSENSNLEDSGNSLPAFSSWTNLKLHIIPVTPTLVKKVIINLYSLKSSGADCIPVVVFKSSAWIFIHSSWAFTYVSEGILFSRLVDDFICGHSSYEYWERYTARNYCSISRLSVANRIFEKLVNNRLVDYFEKGDLFLFPI